MIAGRGQEPIGSFDTTSLGTLLAPLYGRLGVNPGALLQYVDQQPQVGWALLHAPMAASNGNQHLDLKLAHSYVIEDRVRRIVSGLHIAVDWNIGRPQTFSTCALYVHVPMHGITVSPKNRYPGLRVGMHEGVSEYTRGGPRIDQAAGVVAAAVAVAQEIWPVPDLDAIASDPCVPC